MAGPPPGYGGDGGGSSSGSSGAPPGFSGGGGTATTRAPLDTVGQNVERLHRTSGGATPSARKVRRKTKKIKAQGGDTGVGGLLGEFGHLVSGLPTGLYHMAESGAKEAVGYSPVGLVKGIAHGDPNEAIQGVPGIGAGVGIAEGLAGGATGDEDIIKSHPLSGMQGGSFRNTYEDVIDPERFVDAYKEGHLLGKLVEDAANVSIVGGVAGGVLNTASKGAFADAANAAKTASSAERALPGMEAEAAKLAKIAEGHQAEVAKLTEALEKGPRAEKPALRQTLRDVEARARESTGASADYNASLAGHRQAAEAAKAASDAKLATASGPLYNTYRLAHSVAHLSGQGANMPAKPFELAAKGFSAGLKKVLGENPAIREGLARADAALGEAMAAREPNLMNKVRNARDQVRRAGVRTAEAAINRKERVELAGGTRTIEGTNAEEALKFTRAMESINRVTGGDEVVFQTGVLDRVAGAKAIAEQVARLEGLPDEVTNLQATLDEAAERMHYDPQALRNAVDLALGRADPALAEQVAAMNRIWDARIAPTLEAWITDQTQGLKADPSDEERDHADWTLSDTAELSPGLRRRMERLEEKVRARREREFEKQDKAVTKTAEKAGVTPGARGVGAEREAAAAANEGTTGRGSLGALRRMQEGARSEGRAQAGRSAAERIQAVRASIPGTVDDAVITRIVDASDRLRRATEALHTAQGEASMARGLGDTSVAPPSPAELIKRVKGVRDEAVGIARSELDMLNDTLPASQLPFIPGDLSEYHAALHEGISGRETGVLTRYEELRLDPRNRRLSDADVFVKAYRSAWTKLSPELRATLEKMDDAAVRELWRQHSEGTFAHGGLDSLAENYLGDRASGNAEGDIRALVDGYVRKGQVEAFLKNAKTGQWGDHMPDLLRGVIHDPEVARLLDDPLVDHALRSRRLDEAAAGLADVQAQAAAAPLELPEPGSIERASEALGDPDLDVPDNALAVIERAYQGNPDAMSAFFDRWRAAGEPDLTDAMVGLDEGRAPAWATEEGAPAAAPTAPMSGLGALRESEAARSEITDVLANQGGQAVDEALGREMGVLRASASRSEAAAAKRAGAEGEAIGSLTEAGARKGVKGGKKLARYEKALRARGVAQKALDALPTDMANALEQLYRGIEGVPEKERFLTVDTAAKAKLLPKGARESGAGITSGTVNAPAHARPSLEIAHSFTKAITDQRAELVAAGVDDATLGQFDEALMLGIRDVRDIYGGKIAGPDGTLTDAPPPFETGFVPGGQPLRAREEALGPGQRPSVKRPLRTRLSPEQKLKQGTSLPRNVAELGEVLRERITTHTTNEAARMVARLYGRTPEMILGDTADLDAKQVGQAMAAEGYVPWDPAAMIQGAKTAADAGKPGVLWLPEHIKRAVDNYYGKTGGLERFMRRYYDKPITFWKAAVLALRPAWHVNNILSNALMAMVGSGMDPITYAKRMRQSFALLKLPEAQLDVALPEGVVRTGPMSARRMARATSPERLAKLQRIVNTIEPDTLAALGGPTEAAAPQRIVEGKAGAAMLQPEDVRPTKSVLKGGEVEHIMREPGRLKKFIDTSYEINGAVDDANRLAVFLDQRKKLNQADLYDLMAKHPEMATLSPERLRTEGAVRMSLRIAGDFTRMSPVERQVFRRIFPFYVWMRHITGLTAHLVAYHPLRVAWGLKVADMFGTPEEFGLASAVPLGLDKILQAPTVVPFGDSVQSIPTPDSPDALVRELGFSMSPVAKLGAGALAGFDLNKWSQFQRPAGQPGGFAGPQETTPLLFSGRFGELANLIGNQFPQTRAVRGITDTITQGKPVNRYPLGQVRRSPKGEGSKAYGSGEPTLGPLARYLGVPYFRSPSEPFERADVKVQLAELRRRRRKAGRR